MLKLRDKNEMLKSFKGEYEKAKLSMVELFSQALTKEDMKEFIRNSEYDVKLSLNKPEMSKKLAEEIEIKFQQFLNYITASDLAELEKLVLYNMSYINLDSDIEFINLRNKYSLKGYVYFLDNKERFPEKILVVPKEIINLIIENIDKLDFEHLEKRDEIVKVIVGLTNLYGVFEIKHLKFMLDSFGIKDVSDEDLENCFLYSNIVGEIFYKYNEYIVHEATMLDMSCDEIINNIKSNEYYIPSYEEVITYIDNEMDVKQTSYKELVEYLIKLTKNSFFDVDEVAFIIYDLCIMDATIDDIFEIISSNGVVFDNKNQLKDMLSLVMNLHNNSRKWINRGFTTNELLKNNNDNIINLNKEKKKVGRNDPCPCGSGKKYKKCCGK